ncbi:MAG TPA: flippase [Candidatus Atribacteria bacterium]|nr:flippase [Candidatus Atribacteria bacterium]
MNIAKTIAKNTLVLMVANVMEKGLALVLAVFIARFLGDVGFGRYAFAFSFVLIFSVFSDLGLGTLTTREVARDKSKTNEYLSNIFFLKVAMSSICFFIIVLSINLLNYPYTTRLAVYIAGASVILNSLADFFRSIFRAYEVMEYEALTKIIRRTIVVGLGLGVLFFRQGLIELMCVFLIGAIFDIFLCYMIVLKKIITPKLKISVVFWRGAIKTALPLGLTAIFMSLYFRFDTVMLSIIKGDAAVGWYNVSYKIIEALMSVPSLFMISVFPVLSRFYITSKQSLKNTYERSFKLLFLLAFPMGIGTTILAERLIISIFSEEYFNSIVVLKIQIWAFLFISLNILLINVINSIDKQKYNTYITATCLIANIILNIILIPKWSYIGAGIASLITHGINFIFAYYFMSKFLYRIPLLKLVAKPVISGISMGIFIYCFRDINLFILVLVGAIVYFAILICIGGVSKDDINLIKKIIKPR